MFILFKYFLAYDKIVIIQSNQLRQDFVSSQGHVFSNEERVTKHVNVVERKGQTQISVV